MFRNLEERFNLIFKDLEAGSDTLKSLEYGESRESVIDEIRVFMRCTEKLVDFLESINDEEFEKLRAMKFD